jgi:hypothetical protein
MKRAKDAQGRYICGDCLERARAAKVAKEGKPVVALPPGRKPVEVMPPLTKDGVDPVLDDLVSKSKAMDTRPCTECGFPMESKAVLCTHCGFNTITGKGTRVAVHRAPKEAKQSSGPASAAVSATTAVVGGIVGGVIGGGIGASIWAFIAYQSHYEIGWIAWAVGGLSGIGTVVGSRGATNWVTAIYATVVAAVAILFGRYFAISMILNDIGLAGAPASEWFFDTFSLWDVLWAFLALPTAFKIGGGISSD